MSVCLIWGFAIVQGSLLVEHVDCPEEAICAALLNALMHKDYSYSASIIINVNSSCIEFINIGGLASGLSVDDIKIGKTVPRNEMLFNLFHRLRLLESNETGIRRIYSLYRDCLCAPDIYVGPNSFRLVLPNMNAQLTCPNGLRAF